MKFFADHTYIINRADREDRKEHAINQMSSLGYRDGDYTVWEAATPESRRIKFIPNKDIDGWNKEAAGLVISTIEILEDAKEKGYERIMICEDDVLFVENAVHKARPISNMLDKTTYDIFHLGHLPVMGKNPIKMGNSIVRLRGSFMCHAYVINSRIFDDMITCLKRMDQPLDHVTSKIFHPQGRCYSVEPALATQKPDYSNIKYKDVNYNIR